MVIPRMKVRNNIGNTTFLYYNKSLILLQSLQVRSHKIGFVRIILPYFSDCYSRFILNNMFMVIPWKFYINKTRNIHYYEIYSEIIMLLRLVWVCIYLESIITQSPHSALPEYMIYDKIASFIRMYCMPLLFRCHWYSL